MLTLNKVLEEANKVETVDEFNNFCFVYKQEYNLEIFTPIITENLSKIIDIKKDLKQWERFIGLLYYYTPLCVRCALFKLHGKYSNYPIECLFELIVYFQPSEYVEYPLWYEPMIHLYKIFYHKIEKKHFEKHLMFINENTHYYILAYVIKTQIHNIPKNSIYADANELLKNRSYHGNHLTMDDIDKVNLISLKDTGYLSYFERGVYLECQYKIPHTSNGFVGEICLETEIIESAILETDEYKIAQSTLSIYDVEGFRLDDFLLYKWGCVKYMSYLKEYGAIKQKGEHLYQEFIFNLIPKALENKNLKALANIKDIMEILNDSLPSDILMKSLTNHSFWKKEQEFRDIFKEMEKEAGECFEEFPEQGSYVGDIGSAYITFKYKKGFSIWLLLQGYANYEKYNDVIVMYAASLDAYEYGNVSRSLHSLRCASKILDTNKIAHSIGTWMN